MSREPYHKEFVPQSSMLPKTVPEYRTPETLQLKFLRPTPSNHQRA